MFSATITGVIKRVVYDNGESGSDAMMKISVESRKQFVKKDDMPNVYPLVVVWGNDADYLRTYGAVGMPISIFNAEYESYKADDDSDEKISFRAGKVEIPTKAISEALEEAGLLEEFEEAGDSKKKKKKKDKKDKKGKKDKKSRSERRSKKSRDEDDDYDEDDDDDEEDEEKPAKKSKKGKKDKKSSSKKSSKKSKSRDDDDDDDYDEDYDDDDDDDIFDDED